MGKQLKIYDRDSGEIIEDIEFSGGYNIQYARNEDSGRIHHITCLNNAKFGEKHWIKNEFYSPIAQKLVSKFKEIRFINPCEILFLEDEYWEPGSAPYPWIAVTRKANKQFAEMTGYRFIIETRKYFTEKMSREQVVLLIYHELRHIDEEGNLKKHDVEDWNNIVATFGTEWASTKANIDDILGAGFDGWELLRRDKKQLTVYDILGGQANI